MSARSRLSSSLFAFIWRYSARDQWLLLLLTSASFPILYLSLSLPKLILNGAIGGNPTALDGYLPGLDRVTVLWVLSALLLALILANGLLKMRLSIDRGIVGERLIRRLRFLMIERVLDPPADQASRLSQGEAVSMITAESEPLTGVMGDAFAQPLFQVGQMLTILTFLFLQNVWLGLAGISLIPVQAYLIPHMQREVNRLHRKRVAEVRQLSETIGESVAGAASLRLHGGRRRRLAEFSERLQRLFAVRVAIFRRKFLIKFINNLLTQITPFLFYGLGGYLVIRGQLSIGALVAAIAAARDIADPWRELLAFWNAAQEASSRYTHLVGRFLSRSGLPEATEAAASVPAPPRLTGDIRLGNVGVASRDGAAILQQLDLTLPGGALIGLEIRDDVARQALADLLTGERKPDFGTVTIGGHDIRGLSADTLAARIGTATSTPFIFRASVADNIRMPLRRLPAPDAAEPISDERAEAARTGNSTDQLDRIWNDGGLTALADAEAVDRWDLRIIEAMGAADFLLERSLDVRLTPARHDGLAEGLIAARSGLAKRLAAEGLAGEIEPLSADGFNASLSLGENLLFAVRRRDPDEAAELRMLHRLDTLDIAPRLLSFGAELAALLARAFREVGADHPLLRRLTSIDAEHFRQLVELADRIDHGRLSGLAEQDRIVLIGLLFKVNARDLGSAVPAHLVAMIVAERSFVQAGLAELLAAAFEPIVPGAYNYSLTVLQNLMAGTVRSRSLAWQRKLRRITMDVVGERGLADALRLLIDDIEAGPGGENLSLASREHIAVTRALIRRPDVLILDHAMASAPQSDRQRMWRRIRELLPESTLLVIEPELPSHEGFDHVFRVHDGRLDTAVGQPEPVPAALTLLADQEEKAAVLGRVAEFRGLRRAQLELLAYASDWHRYAPGDYVFRAGEATDGVYVVAEGRGELRYPEADYEHDEALDDVWPGRMIGDLSVILDGERMASLVAVTEMTCLRIGEQEFRDIFEGDMGVALLLLRTISGHLTEAVRELELATRKQEI